MTIKRTYHDSREVRTLGSKCSHGTQVRRLSALVMVMDGAGWAEAARCNGMDRQTLRDWVLGYNESGDENLKSPQIPGRRPYLTKAQMTELRQVVVDGPDPSTSSVVPGRFADLQD